MKAEEHFYSDDPKVGPADVKTTIEGCNYYFIGNGQITGVVQFCPSNEATSLGLLIMHPEMFGPKRNALTFDNENGLAQTSLTIVSEQISLSSDCGNLDVWWENSDVLPMIHAKWGDKDFTVNEIFYCPDLLHPRIIREVKITNNMDVPAFVHLQTCVVGKMVKTSLELVPKKEKVCFLEYLLVGEQSELKVALSWVNKPEISVEAKDYWKGVTSCMFDKSELSHMYTASRNQLFANVASSGKIDASIWQYNLEWVRDQSMIVFGLIVSGQFECAERMLDRLLSKFVTDKGDTLDSSRERPTSEVELDQNGELLFVLQMYIDWTGDLSIAKKHWDKICATANFPLQAAFSKHGTALLHNQREYWERHALHGIEDGFEMIYQFFVSLGLSSAAYIAELLGHKTEMEKWRTAAENIKFDMLEHPQYALVHSGHFIKRRYLNGEIQREVHIKEDSGLPENIPILEPGLHYLDPDSSSALPIAFDFIDPKSDLAKKTMDQIEKLWNQRWQDGGYGRYHVTSEPDSPGPWPFASLFVARAYLEMENYEKVWRIIDWLNSVNGAKSGAWFEFYGHRPIPPYPQTGIIPWIWAEQLIFFVHHILGIRPSWDKLLIRPRLLTGIQNGDASIRIRNIRLNLHLQKVRDIEDAGLVVNGTYYPYNKRGVVIDMPKKDIDVEVLFP